jgi:hypothetical protein
MLKARLKSIDPSLKRKRGMLLTLAYASGSERTRLILKRALWHFVLLLGWVFLSQEINGQEAEVEPPLAGRPKNFSQIVGRYRIAALAEPTEVFVEEPITLKVRITGQGPIRYQPQRKHLQLFPEEITDDFYVEPVPDLDKVFARENSWELVYRLRPKSSQVQAIPGLRLVYYAVTPNRRTFQTTYADALPIKVKPKPPASVDAVGLKVVQAPEQLYRLVRGETVLAREEIRSFGTPTIVTGVLLGPPLVAVGWLLLWRQLFPNHGRQVQRRKSLAARRALQTLAGEEKSPEKALSVLTSYLGQRLDYPGAEPTPREVEEWLRRRGVLAQVRRQWAFFLGKVAEARFGLEASNTHPWTEQASQLIVALETDPCLARSR